MFTVRYDGFEYTGVDTDAVAALHKAVDEAVKTGKLVRHPLDTDRGRVVLLISASCSLAIF